MKVQYIQYAGDFAEAYDHLYGAGGKEAYYGQAYSVGAVVDQARRGYEVQVLTTRSSSYRRQLEDRLTAVGIDLGDPRRRRAVARCIDDYRPDRVILRMPDWRILRILRRRKLTTLPIFADSFERPKGLLGRIGKVLLRYELRNSSIRWIANHQINASKSLHSLGLDPRYILPYDWVHPVNPDDWEPHVDPDMDKREVRVFYAGSFSEPKGLFDLVRSLTHLKAGGRSVALRVAGSGDKERIVEVASAAGVKEDVHFTGHLEHGQVLREMNRADLVVVPSHHVYPEGLPMTIMESLMVQTPLVISDHPMFVGRIDSGGAVEFFPEKDEVALARKIMEVCGDVDRYRERCRLAADQWHRLNLDLKWADLIDNWLEGTGDDRFPPHSLAALMGGR